MDCYIGIDLGSTTTKTVVLDEEENVIGRGITNSRSNYTLARDISREEAEINSRFMLFRRKIEENGRASQIIGDLMDWLSCKFHLAQHLKQVKALETVCTREAEAGADRDQCRKVRQCLPGIFQQMAAGALPLFQPGVKSKSDFFRDIASSQFLEIAEHFTGNGACSFDRLTGIYDHAILGVESMNFSEAYREYFEFACRETVNQDQFKEFEEDIRGATEYALGCQLKVINTIGTGYGRATLPFPKHQIRSEILCHGLGAHAMFPNTRTVLDIGGQDTKAIQVDGRGLVTHFQMNDRCAAGCGRYLGYIADEMNVGVHELGPLASQSTKKVRINSTCTVFAGAELRERLALGEKRSDILNGLHRAIILRAMSLLARSGGVANEFTFTGGVAKNEAANRALKELIFENYGEMVLNISPDSIYTGALGAALFARRDQDGDLANVDLDKLRKQKS